MTVEGGTGFAGTTRGARTVSPAQRGGGGIPPGLLPVGRGGNDCPLPGGEAPGRGLLLAPQPDHLREDLRTVSEEPAGGCRGPCGGAEDLPPARRRGRLPID